MNIHDTVTLANGVKMPQLGLGVFKASEEDAFQSVKWAIDAGYRSIDTAFIYQNERSVGNAIRQSSVARDSLFITTKVWNSDQGYASTIDAFERSLRELQLDYVDLYLIHWPVKGRYKDTWRALQAIYQQGRARAIGVSNFHTHHLDDLLETAKIVPMVNQIELHPLLSQRSIRQYCQQRNIVVEAWSPLAQGKLLDNPTLANIAQRHHKSIAQVILRWHLQSGIVTIPKSVKQQRIVENADLYDFTLSLIEMETIDSLNQNQRVGTNPDKFNF